MARRASRPQNPDGRPVDADRGTSTVATKLAIPVDLGEQAEREDRRQGLHGLDAMTEASAGLNRAQRDKARIFPREKNADLGHPRMERTLEGLGAVRRPLSGRQMKARAKAKRAALETMPKVQLHALDKITHDQPTWQRLNAHLSDNASDIDELPETDRAYIKRVDRAIQHYESRNDRGHVVYANVSMPSYVNRTSLRTFVDAEFQPGDEIAFDRYTGTSHSLHKASQLPDPAGRIACFEIQTRRGIYLGRSEGTDDTGHLLPRGMLFRVVGTKSVSYQGPDGRQGERVIIQLHDITPEPARKNGR